MSLLIPREGACFVETTLTASNAEFGTTVTANATPHTKTTTPAQIIASTGYTAYGIVVGVGNNAAAASTNTRALVDIMIGAGGSEQVLIPNLLAGNVGLSASAATQPQYYFFPIMIPSGSRLSARSQHLVGSTNLFVSLHLIQNPAPGAWYGSRVTAYGPNTGTSTGIAHTPSNNTGSYATTTQITASTTNPIKAMQVGIDLATDTTGNTARGLLRIAAQSSTNYVVSGLPFRESTTLETLDYTQANLILSQMRFNIPAASYLGVGAQMSVGAEARGFAIYGVD